MNRCRCWAVVLAGILVLPRVAVAADPAKDALDKGMACLERKDFDAAIPAFTEAIRLNSKSADAYSNRGFANAKTGEIDKAITDFNEALRLDPKLARAYYRRGWAYNKKCKYDQAIADYNAALRLDPKLAVAYAAVAVHVRRMANTTRRLATSVMPFNSTRRMLIRIPNVVGCTPR